MSSATKASLPFNRADARRHLEQVITAWKRANKPDKHAGAVCARLLDSEAPISFAAIRPDGSRWDVLLGDCVIAERAARESWKVLSDSAEAIRQSNEAAAALRLIEKTLLPRICTVADEPNPVADAIGILGDSIYAMRLSAERCIGERSRKTDQKAQRSAAIGWIKESVRRASGANNWEHVRTLAEAALGTGNISPASVRKAVSPSDALMSGYSRAKSLALSPQNKTPKG